MSQCQHTIRYDSGRTAHCSLSEHTHILHEWVYDDELTPSTPATELQIENAENNLRDLFNI